jgi:hypothetical protein
VLSSIGLCDELITRPEESYRLCCVVVCDLETSTIGVPYIYDISSLRVKQEASLSPRSGPDVREVTKVGYVLNRHLLYACHTNRPFLRYSSGRCSGRCVEEFRQNILLSSAGYESQIPPKRRCQLIIIHGLTIQKTRLFMLLSI